MHKCVGRNELSEVAQYLREHDLVPNIEGPIANDEQPVEEVLEDFSASQTQGKTSKPRNSEHGVDVEADCL